MAVVVKTLIPSKQAEIVQTTQYTAVNCKAIIDKFTATNVGATNEYFTINLVTVGDATGSDNIIVFQRYVAPGETYTFPEVVGHVLENGGYISTNSSSFSFTIRASGREITS